MSVNQLTNDAVVQKKELKEALEVVRRKLSRKQQQAIELVFYSNMSIDKAAKVAGCSSHVFSQRINDTKRRLAVLLKQFQDY